MCSDLNFLVFIFYIAFRTRRHWLMNCRLVYAREIFQLSHVSSSVSPSSGVVVNCRVGSWTHKKKQKRKKFFVLEKCWWSLDHDDHDDDILFAVLFMLHRVINTSSQIWELLADNASVHSCVCSIKASKFLFDCYALESRIKWINFIHHRCNCVQLLGTPQEWFWSFVASTREMWIAADISQ